MKNRLLLLSTALVLIILNSGCKSDKPFLDRYQTTTSLLSDINPMCIHTIRGMDVDKDGNVYTSGNIFGTVKACDKAIQSSGHSGLMIKSDKDLNCKWAVLFEARKDKQTCFLSSLVVDKKDFILVPGYFNGELWMNNVKEFEASGTFQSFIIKMDGAGNKIWIKKYDSLGDVFLITQLIKTSADHYTGVGIKNDKTSVVFEVNEDGDLQWHLDIPDPDQIYFVSIVEVGSSLYTLSIGTYFLNLREIVKKDNDHMVDWSIEQKTEADLFPIKSHLAADISNGIWIATSFSGTKPFKFGKDEFTSEGDLDSYICQIRNHQQVYSAHIKGKGDQIVTGLFDADKRCISLALAHGPVFDLDQLHHNGSKGLSLIEFNTQKANKTVYSTFPIVNTERERMTNTGIYFRRSKGSTAYLGGTTIKGEGQKSDPTLTIGKDELTIINPIFNSFLVKGVRKK